MKLKDIVAEDFVNYKLPSMFILFPTCSFKCCKEAGVDICQNLPIASMENKDIPINDIVQMYINNPITKAIVCGGLEPIDSLKDLLDLITALRAETDDPIVIYTGYTEKEMFDTCGILSRYRNIIIKFGRFIPNSKPRFDEVLGVTLNSDNQYAVKF